MSTVVVDASLAVKLVLNEPDSSVAVALFVGWANTGALLVAPALFIYEVTNILHQRVRRGEILPDQSRLGLSQLLTGPLMLDFAQDIKINLALSQRALELAQTHGLPATYDPHYLALAEREGCEYWTADQRLWNAVKAQLSWVRWLGERAPAP